MSQSRTKDRSLDVTEGVIWQQLLQLCVPIFVSSFFQQAYTLINTFIVGPIAKMLYNNYFAVKGPAQTTHRIAKHVMDIAYMLND